MCRMEAEERVEDRRREAPDPQVHRGVIVDVPRVVLRLRALVERRRPRRAEPLDDARPLVGRQSARALGPLP